MINKKSVLDDFVKKFISILEHYSIYAIVGSYVAIAQGRTRGTEDIDLFIESIDLDTYIRLHEELLKNNFECIQGDDPNFLYSFYLFNKDSIRYILKDTYGPDMELFFCKDEVAEYQLKTRKKYPLTELNFYFTSVEGNIAYKEFLLKFPKDMEDARYLREVYGADLDLNEINKYKDLIKKYIYDIHSNLLKDSELENNYVFRRDKSHLEQIIRSAKFVK